MRPSIVGTTMAWVMRSSLATRTHSAASNDGRYMIRRPEYSELNTAETPAMWYGGTQMSCASSGEHPRNSTDEMMYETKCRCRSTAALGSEVVPLVNSSTATSSGLTKGCAPASPADPAPESDATDAANASTVTRRPPS